MPSTKEFNHIVKGLRSQIEALAGLTVRKYRKQAARDGKRLLTSMKKDLKRWTDLLEQDALTTSDFEWLVKSQADSIKMSALERAGLALVRADTFKNSVFNLIIDATFDVILDGNEVPDTPA